MIVYSAFSASVVQGVWTRVAWWQIVLLVVLMAIIVVFMLWLTDQLAGAWASTVPTVLRFSSAVRRSRWRLARRWRYYFWCGSLGLMMLPTMIFHQVQLMICTWLAGRYALDVVGAASAKEVQ